MPSLDWFKGLWKRKERIEFYSTYASALHACPGGYEDHDLVGVVMAKTIAVRDGYLCGLRRISLVDAQILYPLSLVTAGRVLDFGGGCGIHRAVAEMVFGNVFDWQIVEVPAMVRAGREVWGDGVFFERVQDTFWLDGGRQVPDIVLAVGSLPCTSAPYAALQKLVGLGASYLYISRTVMADEEMYGVQWSRLSENGPGPLPRGFRDRDVYYPMTVLERDRVEAILAKRYDLLLRFDEVAFGSVRQYGYLGRIKCDA